MKISFLNFVLSFLLCFPALSIAQMPLITDNTGTQGKSNGQIEISNGLGFHNEHRCVENSSEISPVFSYGLTDKSDFVVGFPFLNTKIYDDTTTNIMSGFSDLNIEFKYRFLEKNKISLAIKPGFSIPTGNYVKGLGSGKFSPSMFFITTLELEKMFLNGNIGYLRNENKCGDDLNIWHISFDADIKLSNEFHFVLNSGIEKNPDISDKTLPVFGLAGFYYNVNENCELSLGYKYGITQAETKHAFIYGLTLRF